MNEQMTQFHKGKSSSEKYIYIEPKPKLEEHEVEFLKKVHSTKWKNPIVTNIFQSFDKLDSINDLPKIQIDCPNPYYRAIAHVEAKRRGLHSRRTDPGRLQTICDCGVVGPVEPTGGGRFYHTYPSPCGKYNVPCFVSDFKHYGNDYEKIKEKTGVDEVHAHRLYRHVSGVIVSKYLFDTPQAKGNAGKNQRKQYIAKNNYELEKRKSLAIQVIHNLPVDKVDKQVKHKIYCYLLRDVFTKQPLKYQSSRRVVDCI